MQKITIPMSVIMTLMVNDDAQINHDSTQMVTIIENDLLILIGDFKGIETAEDLAEIVKRNLK